MSLRYEGVLFLYSTHKTILFISRFTNSMTYVGLYMLSMTMPGDRYLNLFLSSIVETPAALILFPVVLR